MPDTAEHTEHVKRSRYKRPAVMHCLDLIDIIIIGRPEVQLGEIFSAEQFESLWFGEYLLSSVDGISHVALLIIESELLQSLSLMSWLDYITN